ncbi:MAG: alkaline phosphatase [Novosphingobium lindaniclasticum]|jgi:alkaline phosphatase D|uniref:alkaline phosphatase D family protein n=1 Tax=Novosphingobium lindaniclasticum TaxID=1329895 RepID=UPI0024093891|nr:alkaline phosphatase D family protein [Novosphingobium lindaniclasticum]MDF2640538.1 alkaline phosphatase [Novosphingobium lindaniclasticum]
MTGPDRRSVLAGLAFAGGSLAAGGARAAMPRNLRENPAFLVPPFQLGVASGDPSPDGFVIWTRLAPEPLQPGGGMIMAPVPVAWEVAADEAFRAVVAKGEAIAHPELAHSVHVEVSGLQPDRPYWYRFRCGTERSLPGRGATLPLPGAPKDRVRFAVAGCQHYEEGHYTAWRRIAEEPVDFVFHYGDYIYEGRDTGAGSRLMNGRPFSPLRRHLGDEIYSLDDYRRRYALYKSDHDLQAAHAAAPWFVSFDDHEIDNNWANDRDQDGTAPEVFAFRRAAAMQAYYEHMPLRRSSMPQAGHMQMFRRARFGDLLDAHFLDTRQYRSPQARGGKDGPIDAEVRSAQRTMLGDRQEAWLFEGLARSDARWQMIAQQVMLMQLAVTPAGGGAAGYSMDQWSGYLHSRERLLGHIADRRLTNVVTVSGDAHRHFAGDLLRDGGEGRPVAAEFLATSITSGSDGVGEGDVYHRSVAGNACLKAITDRRGYVLCDVTRDTWRGDLKVLDSVMRPDGRLSTFASFVAERGRPGLLRS